MTKRRLLLTETSSVGSTCHTTKLYRVSEFDEWQIEFSINGVQIEGATYHTNDFADAEQTIESYHNHY